MLTIDQFSLKQQVIIHLNYRDIFGFPIKKDELISWINLNNDFELTKVLKELEKEELIAIDGNYICCPGKEWTIEERKKKKDLTATIIKSGKKFLKVFNKIPYLKYIGISGSVAAENPTVDLEGPKKGIVDLDIFLISRANALWVSYLIVKSIHLLINAFRPKKYYLCFNYVMDESDIEIHNKNFFTATELYNLKSLFYDAKPSMINNNLWIKNYYPGIKIQPTISTISKTIFIIKWLNFSLFSLFQFLRIFKRKNFHPIREINKDFNIGQRHNLKRVCPPNGGYQELIKKKFTDSFKKRYEEYYSNQLVEFLFPSLSLKKSATKSEVHFNKEVFDNFKRYAQY